MVYCALCDTTSCFEQGLVVFGLIWGVAAFRKTELVSRTDSEARKTVLPRLQRPSNASIFCLWHHVADENK